MRLAEDVTRAAMLMIRARMVAVSALPSWSPARVPAGLQIGVNLLDHGMSAVGFIEDTGGHGGEECVEPVHGEQGR